MLPLLLSLAALTTALPTTGLSPHQTKPYQIRGVEDPIYRLYLQALPSSTSTPVMGPEAYGEFFIIGSTIQSTNTSMYLNIGTSTTSYLPLHFNSTASATAWGLEGDTIITESGSVYGWQLNFLVCAADETGAPSGYFDLYLQTGSDTPVGRNCSNYQSIHLPCLC